MDTPVITLVKVNPIHKFALQQGNTHLEQLLGVSIPNGWPQFPEAFVPQPGEQPSTEKWGAYFFVFPQEQALVGNGGFYGPPKKDGEVEIGYEIAPTFRNRGLATVAVQLMLDIAFSEIDVKSVIANTLAEENASNAVLKKVGMSLVAELPNPEVGSVWLWKKLRSS